MNKKWLSIFVAMQLAYVGLPAWAGEPPAMPVILDTDIGDDIDDAWALGLALKSPELDVKLVVGEFGKSEYRAKLLAKFLTDAGRPDVAVGVGMEAPGVGTGPGEAETSLIKDYDLKQYAGPVKKDGVQAIIDLIMSSPVPVTVICVGPPVNIAEALKRQPEIAHKAKFVGMFGSVRVGYGGSKTPSQEWNAKASVASTKVALSAPWDMTITPLDTCGSVQLTGADYQAVLNSNDPVAKTVIENYLSWKKGDAAQIKDSSTTLFDTVAVYLAFSHAGLKMEQLPIAVTDQGMTVIQTGVPMMSVATEWTDKNAFLHLLSQRLAGAK